MIRHPRILPTLTLATLMAACDAEPDDTRDMEASELDDALGRPLTATALAAIEGNEEVAEDAVLLARVEVQPGEVIEFYEPSPGMIVVSGTGRPQAPSIVDPELVASLDVTELWALVSEEADMPEALADAVQRSMEPRSPTRSLATIPDEPTPDAAPQHAGGFQAEPHVQAAGYCDSGYLASSHGACPNHDWEMCLDDWWNGAWGEHDDARTGYTSVCPAVGNIALQVYWSNGGGGLWTVNQNYYRWWSNWDWDCETGFDVDCPTFRVDVTQAANNRFHLRMLVDE